MSFNELNIATVITFEREPSSGDEEEEEEAQEVPDRGETAKLLQMLALIVFVSGGLCSMTQSPDKSACRSSIPVQIGWHVACLRYLLLRSKTSCKEPGWSHTQAHGGQVRGRRGQGRSPKAPKIAFMKGPVPDVQSNRVRGEHGWSNIVLYL